MAEGIAEGIAEAAERRALLDVEARACLRINRLGRIDRHRTLADSACYPVELRPSLMVDHGREATLQWGTRLVRGPVMDVARVTVIPWDDDVVAKLNPRSGNDPEINHRYSSPRMNRSSLTPQRPASLMKSEVPSG